MEKASMEYFSCDVLVPGSGAADLRAAIAAREAGFEVMVISKGKPGKSTCTGFSAGVMAGSQNVSAVETHLERTLEAGRGLNQRQTATGHYHPGEQVVAQRVGPSRLVRRPQERFLLPGQYRRLAARRGKKRAILAVAHSLLTVIYHMLKTGSTFKDLGGNYFDKLNKNRLLPYLVRRFKDLGYQVTLEAA